MLSESIFVQLFYVIICVTEEIVYSSRAWYDNGINGENKLKFNRAQLIYSRVSVHIAESVYIV
jgi:hypothetical protein